MGIWQQLLGYCFLPGTLNQRNAVGKNVLVFLVIQNGGLLPFGGATFTGGIVTPATTSSWPNKNRKCTPSLWTFEILVHSFFRRWHLFYNSTVDKKRFTCCCCFCARPLRTNIWRHQPVDFMTRELLETVPNSEPIRINVGWKLDECLENTSTGCLECCPARPTASPRKRHLWRVLTLFSRGRKLTTWLCFFQILQRSLASPGEIFWIYTVASSFKDWK